MKFGGTSVADPAKIKDVARRLVEASREGNRVVAVLSAMGDSTDDLVRFAYEVSARPKPRELEMLISVSERISCALAAMAIHDLGAEATPARVHAALAGAPAAAAGHAAGGAPLTLAGSQAALVAAPVPRRAQIADARARRLLGALRAATSVLVAGSQGVATDFGVPT